MSYHKTSRKFQVTRAAPRLCTVEMKASRELGSTNYTHELLVPLCVQQTTDVNQVMPKRLRAVLRPFCVLELNDTWLCHLAEKVRHEKLGGPPDRMLAQVPAHAEALRRKGWLVVLDTVDAANMYAGVLAMARKEHENNKEAEGPFDVNCVDRAKFDDSCLITLRCILRALPSCHLMHVLY